MSNIHADLTAIAATLGQINKWLDKAEAYAAAKSFDPTALLSARLAADQFALSKQIQVASDWVKNGHARLADKPAPALPEAAQTFGDLRTRIATTLRRELSPRHVPDRIEAVPGIPRTLSGKKLEVPVKRILTGTPPDVAASRGSLANPETLDHFAARRA